MSVRRRLAVPPESGESGSAVLPVMLLMFLFSAIAIAMVVVLRVETVISARFVEVSQALYAADAALGVAIGELRGLEDWSPVLAGASQSAAADGPFMGAKALPRGGSVLLCCGRTAVADRLAREAASSPAAARRTLPWRPFLWSPLARLLPASPPTALYVVVFVEDDEEDGDGDGDADANGRVVLRAEAIQPDGLRRSVEALIAREADRVHGLAPAIRLLRWREVR
jgi:hypothetical protein